MEDTPLTRERRAVVELLAAITSLQRLAAVLEAAECEYRFMMNNVFAGIERALRLADHEARNLNDEEVAYLKALLEKNISVPRPASPLH
jgi:hypothetical protein